MNLNELAKEVARLEGGSQNLSIAQIKEVIKCISITLYLCKDDELHHLVFKLDQNGRKHVEAAKKANLLHRSSPRTASNAKTKPRKGKKKGT